MCNALNVRPINLDVQLLMAAQLTSLLVINTGTFYTTCCMHCTVCTGNDRPHRIMSCSIMSNMNKRAARLCLTSHRGTTSDPTAA